MVVDQLTFHNKYNQQTTDLLCHHILDIQIFQEPKHEKSMIYSKYECIYDIITIYNGVPHGVAANEASFKCRANPKSANFNTAFSLCSDNKTFAGFKSPIIN